MPAQRILADHRAHPLRQPVKPAAHVRRLARQPHAHPRPARRLFVQRPQTRQPPHAALSSTAASARTNSRSNPGPTRRLRPFLSTTSTRRSPTAPRRRSRCRQLHFHKFRRATRAQPLLPPEEMRRAQLALPAKRRHLCPLRPCSETNLCHFRRACLLRSRCVIAPASLPSGHDATLPHTLGKMRFTYRSQCSSGFPAGSHYYLAR